MRRSLAAIIVAIAGASCHSGAPLPPAEAIVNGTVAGVRADTIDEQASIRIQQGKWEARNTSGATGFWDNIAVLDIASAERAAVSLDERTFAAALRLLMAGKPEDASVAFRAIANDARDPLVRIRARIGLTIALSWNSDWPALASIGEAADSSTASDPLMQQAAVEHWAHALGNFPPPRIDVPELPFTVALRRSEFGTPLVTVRINGKPREFWLDTGASMTLISTSAAVDAGVRLASDDTLALGVVSGHIGARAVMIDSLGLGGVVARGLSAALVNPDALRLDRRMVNGVMQSVQIDGVIGTDILRHVDLVLDAEEGTITMRKPRRDSRTVRNLFWVGYPVVRFVTRDGHTALFGLDTGADGTYITTSMLRKEPDTRVALRRGVIGGLGSAENQTKWVVRDLGLSDGDYALNLHNIPVAPERRWTFVTFDGIIGSDVALHTRLHLDFVNGVFDVRRPASTPGGPNVIVAH